MSDTQYESSCHIWPGLIAIHPAQLQIALRHLRGSGTAFEVEELTGLLVQGYYSEVSGSDDVRDGAEDRAQVLLNSIAGLIAVDNPTEQSQALRAADIEASPIHAFGYSGHSGMMPGTIPDDFTGDLPTNGCERSKRIVAVIDSGIVPTGHVDSWKKSGCVQFDDLDIEQLETSGNSASHGTFVTSIIRTVAPTVRVSVARAGALDINQFETMETQEGHDVAQWPTTELHVADAMLRLLERHRQERVVALNLSLGARLCYTNDPVLVVLRNSLRMWMKQQPLPECTCG